MKTKVLLIKPSGGSLKILVNAVAAKMGGGLRHLRGFVSALGEVDKKREYFIYVDSDVAKLISSAPNVHVYPISFVRKSLFHAFYWHQICVPSLVRKHKIDIILSILNFGPIKTRCKQIVFQRNALYFSKPYMQKINMAEKALTLLRRRLAYRAMMASEIVVTPTNSMREMISAIYPQIPKDKFCVIPHAIDSNKFLHDTHELKGDVVKMLEKTAGEIKLLYVSHPAPHKGFEILFRAIKILKDKGIRIKLLLTIAQADRPKVVIGYERLIEFLKIEDEVIVLGRIPSDSITNLYRIADIFVFPSWCESFGYPLLEAQIAGLPIIAADTKVNREMCRDNATYYAPFDPLALSLKIEDMIFNKESKKSPKNVPFLSWQDYVSKIINLFEVV
ncbi:MAG: glycosyltransferase family 4 protein [Candidatus Saganbacteria bacterium]|nr:glycosyltransferase family 4 protein [Candidatus Saganbacteria bacterium]